MVSFSPALSSVGIGAALAVGNFVLSLFTARLASNKKTSTAMGITMSSMIVRLIMLGAIFIELLKLRYYVLTLVGFVFVFTVLTWFEAILLSRGKV